MTDTINLYPKTSCPCSDVPKNYKIPKNSIKSNLSINGCKPPPFFETYDRLEFNRDIQPKNKVGKYELNPQAYTNKIVPDFGMVPCKTASSCPTPSWMSWDPLLFSNTRVNYTPLDRPPTYGQVRMKNIYKDGYTYDNALGYQTYDKIGDGDITYYIDESIQDAFYHPVFSEPAEEQSQLFIDPMGGIKPEYNRKPIINTENPTTTKQSCYPYSLSFIQDSQSQREDLMSLQTRKMNQTKWSARWANSEEDQ